MKDKEKNIAKDLAFELLGNIKYGDTRDNPEWQEKVLKSAENIISQILQEEREKTIEECVNKLDLYLRFEKTELDVTNSGRYFEASQLNENLKNLLNKE